MDTEEEHYEELSRLNNELVTMQRMLAKKNAELRQSNDNLEKRVRIRTLELEAARQDAELANKAKGAFLSRMSHELLTPLNSMLGFAQLMEIDIAPGGKQAERLAHIIDAGRQLVHLIDAILNVTGTGAADVELDAHRADRLGTGRRT